MDQPSSMIIPDQDVPSAALCGHCWSGKLRFYGGEYEGRLAVMVVCENCGWRSLHPLLELPEPTEGGANG